MKIYLSWLPILCFTLASSCAPQAVQPENTQVIQSEPVIEDNALQDSSANNVPAAADIPPANESTENRPPQQEQTSQAEAAAAQTTSPEQKPAIAYPDPFDGASIDTEKYSVLVKGPGSIIQNNKIIATGNANKELIWNILYPNEKIDFTKDFTVTVDVNLTAEVDSGDAMAILAVEPLDKLLAAEMPERNYCEISTGSSHGTMIRTVRTGHGKSLTKTSGKMKISFNAVKQDFTCGLDDNEQSYEKKIEFGNHRLALRAGIHDIGSGTEKPGTGSFTVIYDNLDVVTKKD